MNRILTVDQLLRKQCKYLLTSGGYAPIHNGHIACFREARDIGWLANLRHVACVNGDGFLMRKHGYVFQDEKTRANIVAEFKSVDYVIIWDDGSNDVSGLIKILQPKIFCKGGDRTFENMNIDEICACTEVGCKIEYGVGGTDKDTSSSKILKDFLNALKK